MAALAARTKPGLPIGSGVAPHGPTYTVDHARAAGGMGSPLQMFFITGADAFAEIET